MVVQYKKLATKTSKSKVFIGQNCSDMTVLLQASAVFSMLTPSEDNMQSFCIQNQANCAKFSQLKTGTLYKRPHGGSIDVCSTVFKTL